MNEYKGYFISACQDGTFDILDSDLELLDGEFESAEEARKYIDEYVG